MAWRTPKPTVEAVRKLLFANPDTTILTCSRKGAEEVNECALEALYSRFPPLAIIDGDVESYAANYDMGDLRDVRYLQPAPLRVYKGMRVYLTRNVRKDVDFVNGMLATVLRFNHTSKELRVRT